MRQRIHQSTSLYGRGLGVDSLDAVFLISRLKDQFDVLRTEIGPSLETLGRCFGAIEQKRAGRLQTRAMIINSAAFCEHPNDKAKLLRRAIFLLHK
jgi:acyl carrier protein